MATNRELEARIKQLEAMLERSGLVAPTVPMVEPQDRPDYIEFGSPQHAGFLGLVPLEDGQTPPMGQRHVFKSEQTGGLYCLEDELGVMRYHPGLSLDEVAPVILRQKVGEYESGPPSVPEKAPMMWTPTPETAIVQ